MWSAIVGLIVRLFSLFLQRKSATVTEAEDVGAATSDLNAEKVAVKTETAVATAEANAPSTVSGVESRLNDGSF